MGKLFLVFIFITFSSGLFSQVGIGTTTPNASSALDISSSDKGLLIPRIALGNITDTKLDGINTAAIGLLIYNTNVATTDGNGVGYYYFNGTAWERLTTSDTSSGKWVDSGANIKRLAGNVYIGDASGTNNDLYISNKIIDWDNSNYFLDPESNSNLNEVSFDNGSTADVSIYFDDTNTGFYSPGADIVSLSTNGTESLRVDAAGRLGIGTIVPSYALDVAGDINTSGNIRQSGGAYTFPDYVFESYFDGFSAYNLSYKLKSLSEVELFLKKHKHLPGVQNRADIKLKGWNVTEGVRSNLEKIEEAYLYIIQLNKQNDQLLAKLEAQQKEIDEIKALLKKQ